MENKKGRTEGYPSIRPVYQRLKPRLMGRKIVIPYLYCFTDISKTIWYFYTVYINVDALSNANILYV
jgi:hypothetical protein